MEEKEKKEKVDWIGSNRIDLESSGLEKEGFYATKKTLNTKTHQILPSFNRIHSRRL